MPPEPTNHPGFWRAMARGATRRCPRCGQGRLFRRWFRLKEVCPRCFLRFEREEAAWLGSISVNYGLSGIVGIAYLVLGLVLTQPDPPLFALTAVGLGLVTVAVLFFYPFSKTIWAAIDLLLHADRRDTGVRLD